MANGFTVAVEGSNVKQGVNYVKTPNSVVAVNSVEATPAPHAVLAETPAAAPETPARPLSLIEQFHPELDPGKVEMTWDEKTGRVRIAPKAEAAADETQGQADELPALATPHQDIPGGSAATQAATPATGELADLKTQLAQMTNLVTVMAQAQMSGKPLTEVLGVQTPATPAEPDYSQVDLYDPANLAAFIKQTVQGAMQGVMAPHQQTIESARRRQEYDTVALKFGVEPHFNQKAVAAIQLVADNPALTIEQAYQTVSKIQQALIPSQTAAATTQPAATQATRTITAAEAQAKAEQAARLPGNSGVKGAGAAVPPAHIKGLGQLMAWNLQQASQGN